MTDDMYKWIHQKRMEYLAQAPRSPLDDEIDPTQVSSLMDAQRPQNLFEGLQMFSEVTLLGGEVEEGAPIPRTPFYICRICGTLAADRRLHWNYVHGETVI